MDGSVTFALLRSGEIRCHRSSTGQILASGKLPRGRQLQAATLLGCETFILGDDQGGLSMLQRDLGALGAAFHAIFRKVSWCRRAQRC